MNDILHIIKNSTPLIDLRAEVEFTKGSFPKSINLPILNNDERAQVGITYKLKGENEAIKLGHKLVEKDKSNRISKWADFIQKNPSAHLYCMRGGKRSQIAQTWLSDEGISVPIVDGGFKALRNAAIFIIDSVEQDKKEWLILGGRTGSGKTAILNQFNSSIDLEFYAKHRGSAFGNYIESQPSPINFENSLASKYIKQKCQTIFLEDESRRIGKLALPMPWIKKMQKSNLIIIDLPLDERIQNIYHEYVSMPLKNGTLQKDLKTSLNNSLFNIRKRLGPVLYKQINRQIELSLKGNNFELSKNWIKSLLTNYYDPMYDYQLTAKMDRCILKDTKSTILQYLKEIEYNQKY